jgi:coenzyme F420-reducing hydrogenase alpha subunit
MTGALARLNIAKDHLHSRTKEDAKEAISRFPSKNIYHNNLAQAIEILHAIDSSIDLLKNLQLTPERPPMLQRHAGTGIGVIEAPRGMLFYKIELNEKGSMSNVEIIVPTGQNQIGIEEGLHQYFQANLARGKEQLVNDAERIVRAYDPCMSCASHFLQVKWKKKRTTTS